MRRLIAAAVFFALSAGLAHAQVTGSIPGTGGFDDQQFYWNVLPSYDGPRTVEERLRDREIERKYSETVKARIPDRKPASSDPWRSVRRAPTPAAYDRHRPE